MWTYILSDVYMNLAMFTLYVVIECWSPRSTLVIPSTCSRY